MNRLNEVVKQKFGSFNCVVVARNNVVNQARVSVCVYHANHWNTKIFGFANGASIGKLDDELLFYLCSRGFSEQEAVDMMAKAKIDALCRKIDDEDTVQLVQRYLEGVMADGE